MTPADAPLTPERILDTAEDVLRRFGPAKTTVVDVARALGVSHGSVYRHFGSKAALRDAVVERWLARVTARLDPWVEGDGPAGERLRGWVTTLIEVKREKTTGDPELFATYSALAADADGAVDAHVERMAAQLAGIIRGGVERGEFSVADPAAAGRAVLGATARFHHPAHAAEWTSPTIDAEFDALWELLAAGLSAPRATA